MHHCNTKSIHAIGEIFPVANCKNERKVTNMRKLFLTLVALIATALLFSTANADATTYQRFLPTGLPTSSPQAATSAVLSYADMNEQYGKVIAQQTGSKSFVASDYTSAGWGTAPANTKNSALSSAGSTVAYNDASSVGVKTIRIQNKKTGMLVNVMVRCGNPRIKSGVKIVPKVHIKKILRIWVNKKFTITKTLTCPSGQAVTGTVTGYVRGWFYTQVKGWTTGAKLYYSQQVDLKVTHKLTLKCGASPTPPAATPTPPAVPCPTGSSVVNTNTGIACQGNTSSQDSKETASVANDCKGPNSNSSQCNTLIYQITNLTTIQVNANCSKVTIIYGDGSQNVQYKDASGNTVTENYCSSNTTTTTPPTPPATPPKDGSQGGGSNIPTTTGGSGNGGSAGNSSTGGVCRKPDGTIGSGTSDQLGYCV